MSEQIQWKSSTLADDDAFLDALLSAMETGGVNGSDATELLELVKVSHQEWYQLGTSARSLRQAFSAPAAAKTEHGAESSLTPDKRSGTRAVAGAIAVVAFLGTAAVIGYGYMNPDPAKQGPPQVGELTLTPVQLDLIATSVAAKLPRGSELATLTTLTEHQAKLIADLRAETTRANLARDASDKASLQLREQTTELRETLRHSSDLVTALKAENLAALQTEWEKHSKLVEQMKVETKQHAEARDSAEKSLLKARKELDTANTQAAQYAPMAKVLNDKQSWTLGEGPLLGIDWILLPMPEMSNGKTRVFCLRAAGELYKETKEFKVELKGDRLDVQKLQPK